MSEQLTQTDLTDAPPSAALAHLGASIGTLQDLAARAGAIAEGGFRQETGHLLGEALNVIAHALQSVHVLHAGAPSEPTRAPSEAPIGT
jgi:hypothetical protein